MHVRQREPSSDNNVDTHRDRRHLLGGELGRCSAALVICQHGQVQLLKILVRSAFLFGVGKRRAGLVAHRYRQRRTRCRSTPNTSAWSRLSRPSADNRTMRHRSTICCGDNFARTTACNTRDCLAVTTTATDFERMRPPRDRDTMILAGAAARGASRFRPTTSRGR